MTKYGVYGTMAPAENPAQTLPSIEDLTKAKTLQQVYDALLPSVRNSILPYKDHCICGGRVLETIYYHLASLKDYALHYCRLGEYAVDRAIERGFETVMEEIYDPEGQEVTQCNLGSTSTERS